MGASAMKILDPIGAMLHGGDKKEADKPAEAPAAAPAIEARSPDFEVRKQDIGQRAASAGAARSENDADLLGYTPPRKRNVSREILG